MSSASGAQPQVIATISMTEILEAQEAYKEVMKASLAYRKYMRGMTKHARAFADSLMQFAKATEGSADEESVFAIRQYAAMQLLFAAGNEAMTDLVDSQFDAPLKANYANHKSNVKFNAEKYKRAKEQHARQMKVLEREEARATKNVRSDLNAFQDTLRELSRMATSIEIVKNDHFDSVVDEERRNAAFVAERCADWIGLECNVLFSKVFKHGEEALAVLDGQVPVPLPGSQDAVTWTLARGEAGSAANQQQQQQQQSSSAGASAASRRVSAPLPVTALRDTPTMRPLSTLTRPQAHTATRVLSGRPDGATETSTGSLGRRAATGMLNTAGLRGSSASLTAGNKFGSLRRALAPMLDDAEAEAGEDEAIAAAAAEAGGSRPGRPDTLAGVQ
ncbi:hypothetical protein H9P43_003930 [Blastocladiella emersonii ATCC 22665]|nr:hypothetical protein H9P43_003930 [Blastocladiella emersonii ATCC 22665]